jgi:hypothetical protein
MMTNTEKMAERRVCDRAAKAREQRMDTKEVGDGWRPVVKRAARRIERYGARDEIELALLELAEAS